MRAQQAISSAIAQQGLSQYKVAIEAGVDRAFLNQILAGKKPISADVIDKVAPVLGLDAEELKAWADADRLGEEGIERLKKFVLVDGGLDVPDDIEDPLDDWELEVLHRTGAKDMPGFDRDSDFWYQPKDARRRILENLDENWRRLGEIAKRAGRDQG